MSGAQGDCTAGQDLHHALRFGGGAPPGACQVSNFPLRCCMLLLGAGLPSLAIARSCELCVCTSARLRVPAEHVCAAQAHGRCRQTRGAQVLQHCEALHPAPPLGGASFSLLRACMSCCPSMHMKELHCFV